MEKGFDLPQSSIALRLGLGLTAMALVLLELVLTRVFSVTTGYHFAFMIVSIAMFGMTLGALVTLARIEPGIEWVEKTLVRNSCLFALSTIIVFVLYSAGSQLMLQAGAAFLIGGCFLLFSIPFYFSGVCICLCLSRYQDVGRLYSADLIGAGLSCLVLVLGLRFTNAQNILNFAGLTAALGAAFFVAHMGRSASYRNHSKAIAALTIGLCFLSFFLPEPAISIGVQDPIEYVKWSPVGRVVVTDFRGPAATWARENQASPPALPQKGLYIDFGAFTVMTSGQATAAQLQPIKNDITAVGNSLRPGNSLFVIGVGGGRDVLTGLLFGQRKIDGIEVNPAIVDMLTKKYKDFTGNLAFRKGVNIVNDEARNWLARSHEKYGLIQCSLVDTWAASSSGAFILTENVLYTKEAFELYLEHLEPHGILSFLRWGDENEPGQILRMLNLAKSALSNLGINDWGKHIILIGAPYRSADHNIGDMLVSLEPFSDQDISHIKDLAQSEGYKPLWLPTVAAKEPFASFINSESSSDAGLPSDDCPFFFTPVHPSKTESSIAEPAQGKGLLLLQFTFILSTILVVSTIFVPAWTRLRFKIGDWRDIGVSSIYFSCLGLAFMQVEVGQIERLTVMLGNPTYSLSVVLFALLLASGLGSYAVESLLKRRDDPVVLARQGLVLVGVLVVVSALVSLFSLNILAAAPTIVRIVAAILLVSLPGFFMGWSFPLGIKIFMRLHPLAGPWFWAINGASSVLGSVVAAIISVTFGITATLLTGAALYFIAWTTLLLPLGPKQG